MNQNIYFYLMLWKSSESNKSLGIQEQNKFFGIESPGLKSQVVPTL